MDSGTLSRRLSEVERHIKTGEQFIAQTRKRLETAIRDGRDPVAGEEVLRNLEAVQAAYLDEWELLSEALKLLAH
jgi:hypothetical protein